MILMSTSFVFILASLHFLLLSFQVNSVSMNVPFASSERAKTLLLKPFRQSLSQGPIVTPRPKLPHYDHHHHSGKSYPVVPFPYKDPACSQICTDPFTATPFGSPCGCIFPMKVRLVLGVAPLVVFPVITELEIEVASGTYLKQSQVRIIGVSADNQNQWRTIVDIDLVPLGEKFDNTTALLLYERFWNKKVHLNRSLFGDYATLYVAYPGIPSSLPPGYLIGSSPLPSNTVGFLPTTASFMKEHEKLTLKTILIISLCSAVPFLVLVGAFFILLKWWKVRSSSRAIGPSLTSYLNKRYGLESMLSGRIMSSRSMSLVSAIAASILSVKTFSFSELEKATDKFNSHRVLGEGGFGRVYSGTLDDGNEVAVKLLTRNGQNRDREFIAEVEMLSRLHHRNLVKLFGICIEGRRRCLVYELVCNGSVESHLHGDDKKNCPLDWEARKRIAIGSARGLAYLHEDSNPRVIHRDFKASNVLLEDDFNPKVSDFGLAREAGEGNSHISTRVMGTFGYVAPEYAMTGHLLVKSDVYSYGVVLLELITGRKPVDMSQPQGEENLVTWARPLLRYREGLEKLVDPFLAGKYDFDEMAKMAAIASMCVHPEVTQRPFMGEVVQALKLIYNDTNESEKDSLCHESDFGGDLVFSDSSWLDGEGVTPRLTYGPESSLITMDYSSGLLEMEKGTSSLNADETSLPIRHGSRSGPLKTARGKPSFTKLTRSRSDHVVSFQSCL
ncbi:receptor-like serine/threonine-protein kinase ALE2 isoform X2 [Vigna radiata var. radiata]|uniref:Receptor-like serine/threonine-protein kinase ALE2 isoform X2 n=1 Tax=Vigna radiata var. radiata TaxID=3916 RepID=A0A3Q0F6P5_VIGRR|nr:receptor-like serine/threonine-protein kinase ALE2 isoform X2 [Vigna radiata var. radiata]